MGMPPRALRPSGRMRVCVEEARQDRTTLQVDELRRRSRVLEQGRVVAHGGDVPCPYRDGCATRDARSSVMILPPCKIRSGGSMPAAS